MYLAPAVVSYSGNYTAGDVYAEGNVTIDITGTAAISSLTGCGNITILGNGTLTLGEEAGSVEMSTVQENTDTEDFDIISTGESFSFYTGDLITTGNLTIDGVTVYAGNIEASWANIAKDLETTIYCENLTAGYLDAGTYRFEGESVPVHLYLGGYLEVGIPETHSSAYIYDGDMYVNDILYTETFFWIGEADVTVGKYICMTGLASEDDNEDLIVSLIFCGGPQSFYDENEEGNNAYVDAILYILGNSGDDASDSLCDWTGGDWDHGYCSVYNGGINNSTAGQVVMFGGSTDEIAVHGGTCNTVGGGAYSIEGQLQITSGNLNIMNGGGLATYGRIGINTGSEDNPADSAVNVYTAMTITNAFTYVEDVAVMDHEYDESADIYRNVTYTLYLNEMTYDEMSRIYPVTDDAQLVFTNAMLDGLYLTEAEATEYDGKTCINCTYDVYDASVRVSNANMEASDNSILLEMDENALLWVRSNENPENWYCADQSPNTEESERKLYLDDDFFEFPDYHPLFEGTGGAVEKAPDDKGGDSDTDSSEDGTDGSDKIDDGGANGGNGEGDPMDRPVGGDKTDTDDADAEENSAADGSEKVDDGGANGENGEGDPMDRPVGGDNS